MKRLIVRKLVIFSHTIFFSFYHPEQGGIHSEEEAHARIHSRPVCLGFHSLGRLWGQSDIQWDEFRVQLQSSFV